MFSIKDDARKLVTFYSLFTSVYFPLLILVLYWSEGIYSAGKYTFNSVIFVIIVAELVKYFSSSVYFKTHEVNLSRKSDTGSIVKNLFNKTRIREGFRSIVVVSFMIVAYSAVAILYGAEVFSKYEETLMFSSLLSVLTVLPACLNLGSQSVMALVLGSKPINKMENLIYQNFYLTVSGAWLGAFVIPLDWDRPWQVWPIPCSFGAMFGYAISHFVMLVKVKTSNKRKTKKGI